MLIVNAQKYFDFYHTDHAIYINKFEVIDENISNVTSHSETENVIALNNTCLCEPENISSFCNDTKLLNIMYGTNSSTFRMMKLIMLDDAVFVIMVASDFVSIYLYAPVEQQLYQKAGTYHNLNRLLTITYNNENYKKSN